jgi:phosphonoacetaldehyde dehydrogenase
MDRRAAHADGGELRGPQPLFGRVVGRVGQATEHEVRAALDGAAGRLALPPDERAAVLDRAARHYDENAESAARLITAEAGICLKQARHEVWRAVSALLAAAHEARRIAATDWAAPYHIPGQARAPELHVVPEPVALAVAITPFNHPLNQVVHKVAPAVAAGAHLVIKPSDQAPL